MLDKIIIKNFKVMCIIGIYPEERTRPQDIEIDLEMSCELSAACRSDKIEQTIDYAEIENRLISICKESSFQLIEKLAEEIASNCLQNKEIKEILVRVRKPNALKHSSYAAVEIIRKQ